MAEIKSHEFETFLQKSARNYRIFVIYGPDRGLVSERASLLAARSGVALDDPFSLTKLDIGACRKTPVGWSTRSNRSASSAVRN